PSRVCTVSPDTTLFRSPADIAGDARVTRGMYVADHDGTADREPRDLRRWDVIQFHGGRGPRERELSARPRLPLRARDDPLLDEQIGRAHVCTPVTSGSR